MGKVLSHSLLVYSSLITIELGVEVGGIQQTKLPRAEFSCLDGDVENKPVCVLCLSVSLAGNFKPGVYAVSVTGRLPQGIVRELKSRGVAYKSRDTAIKT
uniref:Uncharacterized protein n=1 Tax=Chrysemys picta bellii TaxID=8478 RepID=A0A8C3HRQ3_CHRPI